MSTGPGAASAPAPTTAHESPPAHGVPEAPPDTTGPRTPDAAAAPAPLVPPGSPTPPTPGPTAPPPSEPRATAPTTSSDVSALDSPAATPEPPAPRERVSMFRSLRVRNYRLFFVGQVVSNIGTWMQRIAQDWLVLSLTGSSTAVGVTMALQFLPMLLFGLYGGVLVDRFPKRRLLFLTQTAMAVTGLALAALTLSHQVQVWHVYVAAFAVGMATVVDNPARQSFVSEMVGPDQLQNAVSLNSANFQSARLVGPAVAGVLITTVGTGWAFLYNGLSFIAPITGLLLMRTRELHPTRRAPRKKGQLREGLRHVAGRPELLWPIVLVGFIGTFGFNFPVWLSAYADDVFHTGAGSYSLFNTLMAVGSVAGALLAARRGTARLRVLIAGALAFGLLEIVAALAPTYWIFALFMVPLGMFGLTVNVTANTAIQMATDPVMRGRVMALYMMVFLGGTPLGAPIAGWVTDAYGPRIGFVAGGVVSTVAAVTVGLVLIRSGGMRLSVGWHGRQPRLRFVPKRPTTKKELVTT
ncbi:MFS transporter [Streptomyces ossamyceticus]|nr:MFS transporter [Streptomyces ossamyceticus]